MLRRLYDWTLNLARHKHATWVLFCVAFAESSFFPIPPDVMLLPMALAAPRRAFFYAFVCTAGSVLGGLAGYGIGYAFFETLGEPVVAFYGLEHKMAEFKEMFATQGWWIVFGAGLTPFPYKIITITSGLTNLNIGVFMAASIVSRSMRFFILAALLWKFGEPIGKFIDKYFAWLTLALFVAIAAGFAVLKLL